MIRDGQKVAVFMEGSLDVKPGAYQPNHKVGISVLRYSRNPVVCAVDTGAIGKDISELVRFDCSCPIVGSIEDAIGLGAEVLIVGIAPTGGGISDEWFQIFDEAVRRGLSIACGLHEDLGPRYSDLQPGQFVWDTRKPPTESFVATGSTKDLDNKRIMLVGTDMAIGKMTAALELHGGAEERGWNSRFLATGQTGITLAGNGIPIDAMRIDFACGAMEASVLAEKDAEYVFVEGQGSVLHPGSCAFVAIMRGSMPTHLVLCHRAGQETLVAKNNGVDWVKIPPLKEVIRLYEDVGENCGSYHRPKTAGVCLNTHHIHDDSEALDWVKRTEDEVGLPCSDPVRHGVTRILDNL